MTSTQIFFAGLFLVLMGFAWLYYRRHDLRRWLRERGPRRQMELEAAHQREAELTALRDELASKYLPPDAAKPPGTDT